MDPRWDPDYRPTWDAFFINRRERALARYEEDDPPPSNFNEAGRRLWWGGRTLQSVMDYITAGDNPRLRYPHFQSRRAPPSTATTTAAATTTTTSTCIIGLGRSMTRPEPHHWLGQMVPPCTLDCFPFISSMYPWKVNVVGKFKNNHKHLSKKYKAIGFPAYVRQCI